MIAIKTYIEIEKQRGLTTLKKTDLNENARRESSTFSTYLLFKIKKNLSRQLNQQIQMINQQRKKERKAFLYCISLREWFHCHSFRLR